MAWISISPKVKTDTPMRIIKSDVEMDKIPYGIPLSVMNEEIFTI